MRNLFFYLMVVLFTVMAASAASVLNRDVQDVEIRVKRSNPWDFFRKNKDKKKKKKGKKTTAKPTTIPTTLPTTIPTTLPTTIPSTQASRTPVSKGKIPRDVLEKIIKMDRNKLEQYLGITKQMSMRIQANVTKDPPPPKQTTDAKAQSGVPGVPDCSCVPTYKRVFLDNHESHLGIHIPSNCIATYQCGGGCLFPNLQECKAVDKYSITHNVFFYYFPHVNKPPEYRQHNVEYHTKCSCECRKRECPPRMFFNDKICDCACKPEYTKDNLKCPARYTYYEDSCSCKCPYRIRVCPLQQTWDEHLCDCKCPNGQVKDRNGNCGVIAMSANNGK